ncbi:hypothetical protein M406DRAFT_70053 [Cryphonectria parasitica EP155]|uniref:DUF7730 domain-containing protein n=1 Tax=Cryphonectria parasitica (strain ATCC 38755 / EP155) TaxID=660469 RepID=A0A9P4Y6P4_CRYP1|nr:uncharacterized protein M406DRAFT_70053 [Cryphonectria parasitica EP155]KAF3767949.1 hypothetical protein M406DRAFT_70053 [Cryphonectria parasitica EP155]
MRARLRKASCLNDDSYDDTEHHKGGEPQPRPPTTSSIPNDGPSPPELSEDMNEGVMVQQQQHREDEDDEASKQIQSRFFARLPLEIRRLIYNELFRATNPLMKMHLHSSYHGAQLTMTPCLYTPKAMFSTLDDERDPMQTEPWPGWKGRIQPPRWFWYAWGLRLKWRGHWKCQAAEMMQWKAQGDGSCVDLRKGGRASGLMGVFLCCTRMYAEAIECLFESTELIFTASEDAYRFFVQNPHSHTSKIRRLDFAFDHFKDHLFLQRIETQHPRLLVGGGGDGDGRLPTAPVSWELWRPLLASVRSGTPELRRFRIYLSPPSPRCDDLVRLLDEWEAEGYGWVTEQADGVIYYEMRKKALREYTRFGGTAVMDERPS